LLVIFLSGKGDIIEPLIQPALSIRSGNLTGANGRPKKPDPATHTLAALVKVACISQVQSIIFEHINNEEAQQITNSAVPASQEQPEQDSNSSSSTRRVGKKSMQCGHQIQSNRSNI
jgi:hypothetical protein